MSFTNTSPIYKKTAQTSASFESDPPYEFSWAASGSVTLEGNNWGNIDNSLTMQVYWGEKNAGFLGINANIVWNADPQLIQTITGAAGTTTPVSTVLSIPRMKSRFMKLVFTLSGTSKTVDITSNFNGKSEGTGVDPSMQIWDGTNIANVGTGDTSNNYQLVGAAVKTTTLSITANSPTAAIDLAGFPEICIQMTAVGASGTMAWQASNDNATWAGFTMNAVATPTTGGVNSATAVGMWHGPRTGRYLRINPTGIASGTYALTIVAYSEASAPHGLPVSAAQNGTWTFSPVAATTGGYSFNHQSANGTTTIKSGAGTLHTVTVNTAGATDTITLYDNIAGSGTVIAVIDSSSKNTSTYDLAFTTGLTAVIAGTTAPDVTFMYK